MFGHVTLVAEIIRFYRSVCFIVEGCAKGNARTEGGSEGR